MKLTTNISPVTVTLSTLCNGFNNKLYYFWLLQRIKYMLVNEGTYYTGGPKRGCQEFSSLEFFDKKNVKEHFIYLLGDIFGLV